MIQKVALNYRVIKKLSVVLLAVLMFFYVPKLIVTYFPGTIQRFGYKVNEMVEKIDGWRTYSELLAGEPVKELPIPVSGVELNQIVDTWGGARSEGRRHEGVDIFADRGTPIVATTTLRISRISYGKRGGNYIFATASGRERYYFAHLDTINENLIEGQIALPGTVLGTVGDTGNAVGTPPHLHFGIYKLSGAINPYPRLVD